MNNVHPVFQQLMAPFRPSAAVPITPERAAEILRTRTAGHLHITPDEKAEILRVWNTLPGWTSIYDAVRHIAGEKA